MKWIIIRMLPINLLPKIVMSAYCNDRIIKYGCSFFMLKKCLYWLIPENLNLNNAQVDIEKWSSVKRTLKEVFIICLCILCHVFIFKTKMFRVNKMWAINIISGHKNKQNKTTKKTPSTMIWRQSLSICSVIVRDNDLQFCLNRNPNTIKRLLSTVWVLELMVGTSTVSSLPFTSPTRSSFSSTASKCFCSASKHKHTRI